MMSVQVPATPAAAIPYDDASAPGSDCDEESEATRSPSSSPPSPKASTAHPESGEGNANEIPKEERVRLRNEGERARRGEIANRFTALYEECLKLQPTLKPSRRGQKPSRDQILKTATLLLRKMNKNRSRQTESSDSEFDHFEVAEPKSQEHDKSRLATSDRHSVRVRGSKGAVDDVTSPPQRQEETKSSPDSTLARSESFDSSLFLPVSSPYLPAFQLEMNRILANGSIPLLGSSLQSHALAYPPPPHQLTALTALQLPTSASPFMPNPSGALFSNARTVNSDIHLGSTTQALATAAAMQDFATAMSFSNPLPHLQLLSSSLAPHLLPISDHSQQHTQYTSSPSSFPRFPALPLALHHPAAPQSTVLAQQRSSKDLGISDSLASAERRGSRPQARSQSKLENSRPAPPRSPSSNSWSSMTSRRSKRSREEPESNLETGADSRELKKGFTVANRTAPVSSQ